MNEPSADPAIHETAFDLVTRAFRNRMPAEEIVAAMSIRTYKHDYRSRNEVDDTEHDPDSVGAVHLAYDLNLITKAQRDQILEAAEIRP